jgi:hypothetical protein
MAELWELILHHSYTGTPGVVFDQSPRRGSHGVAVGGVDKKSHELQGKSAAVPVFALDPTQPPAA